MPRATNKTHYVALRLTDRMFDRIEEARGDCSRSDWLIAAAERQLANRQLLSEYAETVRAARYKSRSSRLRSS